MQLPKYSIDKIKFGTDPGTYEKAVALYENDQVTGFKEELNGYFATVLGTKPYRVYVSNRYYDRGDCECYLGQSNVLCKHLIATAICAVMDGKKMSLEDKEIIIGPRCSGKLGELNKNDVALIKKSITAAMRYIKAYEGPSRTWFAYQGSLQEGCARLSKIVSSLPVSRQTASVIIDMLSRLDNRLCLAGVDDSDGTVGDFMMEVVIVLKEYAKLDMSCQKAFDGLKGKETCFGWELSLIE